MRRSSWIGADGPWRNPGGGVMSEIADCVFLFDVDNTPTG